MGQVRRVWAPRGVKVRQRVQMGREWRYLALAVDGLRGRLSWTWIGSMKKEQILIGVQAWKEAGVEAVVWDRAGGHRAGIVRGSGLKLIEQPAAAPELNPAERVIEELRREVEGASYADLAAKVAAVEDVLQRLAADPGRVQSLAGWDWIRQTCDALT
jgi:hypothetical protein